MLYMDSTFYMSSILSLFLQQFIFLPANLKFTVLKKSLYENSKNLQLRQKMSFEKRKKSFEKRKKINKINAILPTVQLHFVLV